MREDTRPFAVWDTETDPFAPGETIEPFAWGFYDGSSYTEKFCGVEDAIPSFVDFLATLTEPHIIYAHNGGKFDFMFLMPYIDGAMRVIGSRVVQAHIGIHELRDSYAIMPVPLKKLGTLAGGVKDEIDYEKLKRTKRFKHRAEIMRYMKQDCVSLYHAVAGFRAKLGNGLTMASAAMRHMNKVMMDGEPGKVYVPLSEREDKDLRSFYYGGRVQCFERGVIHGAFKIYDVTSMYPFVMQSEMHPVSRSYEIGTQCDAMDPSIDFMVIAGYSNGALPIRADNGSLSFPVGLGRFFATGHEIRAGLDTNRLRIDKLVHFRRGAKRINFAEFINEMMTLRFDAKQRGDGFHDLLWKLVQNSTYGKFAQNPLDYYEHFICRGEHERLSEADGWEINFVSQFGVGYKRPIYREVKDAEGNGQGWHRLYGASFLNVATAASITGAARAMLLRAIHDAERVVYCDTDSIICEAFDGAGDGSKLGGWKLEAEGDRMAIAGKKMYALFNGESVVKKASKGVDLSAEDIIRVAQGETITWASVAPTFDMSGKQSYLKRRIQATR